MSRELRDKADVMMKELNEMLKPLREEIQALRLNQTTSSPENTVQNWRR